MRSRTTCQRKVAGSRKQEGRARTRERFGRFRIRGPTTRSREKKTRREMITSARRPIQRGGRDRSERKRSGPVRVARVIGGSNCPLSLLRTGDEGTARSSVVSDILKLNLSPKRARSETSVSLRQGEIFDREIREREQTSSIHASHGPWTPETSCLGP